MTKHMDALIRRVKMTKDYKKWFMQVCFHLEARSCIKYLTDDLDKLIENMAKLELDELLGNWKSIQPKKASKMLLGEEV